MYNDTCYLDLRLCSSSIKPSLQLQFLLLLKKYKQHGSVDCSVHIYWKIIIVHSKLCMCYVNDTCCPNFLSCTVHSKSCHIAENLQLVLFRITASSIDTQTCNKSVHPYHNKYYYYILTYLPSTKDLDRYTERRKWWDVDI